MRVLDRNEASAARRALAVSNARGEGCCRADLETSCQAIVTIGFAHAERSLLLRALVSELLKMQAVWWLMPLYKYFGDTWSQDQWAAVGLPLLTNHVVECSAEDLAAIVTILTCHYEDGCFLYLASTDGKLLAFEGPHQVLSVAARRREEAELLSVRLHAVGLPHEVHARGSDA